MAVYDYRSAAGWQYLTLPIEQLHITAGSNTIKFDCITKDASYFLEPVVRARGNSKRVVAYRFEASIPVLFNNFQDIIPILEQYFINTTISFDLILSAYNATGQNEWRKLAPITAGAGYTLNYRIDKSDTGARLTFQFSGLMRKADIDDMFNNWVVAQPS